MLRIYAPASSANISVGFDTLGAAISPIDGSLLGDVVQVESIPSGFELESAGYFVRKLPKEPQKNIVYQAYVLFSEQLKLCNVRVKPLRLTLEKNMPIGSGLGSSACSIVAALVALNKFHDEPFSKMELLEMMGELEGRISGSIHYDNVAPCYLGGVQFMVQSLGNICQKLPFFDNWYWVLAYPGIEVSTAEARAITEKLHASRCDFSWSSFRWLCARMSHASRKSCCDDDERCDCRTLPRGFITQLRRSETSYA